MRHLKSVTAGTYQQLKINAENASKELQTFLKKGKGLTDASDDDKQLRLLNKAKLEKNLRKAQNILQRCEISEKKPLDVDTIQFGSRVRYSIRGIKRKEEEGEEIIQEIGALKEKSIVLDGIFTSLKNDTTAVDVDSLLGKVMMGLKVGDVATYKTDTGEYRITIKSISTNFVPVKHLEVA